MGVGLDEEKIALSFTSCLYFQILYIEAGKCTCNLLILQHFGGTLSLFVGKGIFLRHVSSTVKIFLDHHFLVALVFLC